MPADVSSIKQESSILKACCIHFINYGTHSKKEMEAVVRKLGGTVSNPIACNTLSQLCGIICLYSIADTRDHDKCCCRCFHVVPSAVKSCGVCCNMCFMLCCSCIAIRLLLRCSCIHVSTEPEATWLAELFQWTKNIRKVRFEQHAKFCCSGVSELDQGRDTPHSLAQRLQVRCACEAAAGCGLPGLAVRVSAEARAHSHQASPLPTPLQEDSAGSA